MRRYSPREVSRSLGLCVETVRRAIRRGELPTVRSPSGYYHAVLDSDLETWINGTAGKRVLARSLSRRR